MHPLFSILISLQFLIACKAMDDLDSWKIIFAPDEIPSNLNDILGPPISAPGSLTNPAYTSTGSTTIKTCSKISNKPNMDNQGQIHLHHCLNPDEISSYQLVPTDSTGICSNSESTRLQTDSDESNSLGSFWLETSLQNSQGNYNHHDHDIPSSSSFQKLHQAHSLVMLPKHNSDQSSISNACDEICIFQEEYFPEISLPYKSTESLVNHERVKHIASMFTSSSSFNTQEFCRNQFSQRDESQAIHQLKESFGVPHKELIHAKDIQGSAFDSLWLASNFQSSSPRKVKSNAHPVAQLSSDSSSQPQNVRGMTKVNSKKRKYVGGLDHTNSRCQKEDTNIISNPSPGTEINENQEVTRKPNPKDFSFSLDVFGINNPLDKDTRIIGNIMRNIQSNKISAGRLEVDIDNPEEAWEFFRSVSIEKRRDTNIHGRGVFPYRRTFLKDSIHQLLSKSQSWINYWEKNYGIDFNDSVKLFKTLTISKRFDQDEIENFLILFLFYVDMIHEIIVKKGHSKGMDNGNLDENCKTNHIKQALESFEKIGQTLGILAIHEDSEFEYPRNTLHPNDSQIKFTDPYYALWSCLEQWTISLDDKNLHQILFKTNSVLRTCKTFFNDIFSYSIRKLNEKMFLQGSPFN
ncbi:hypothetical protein PGT21_018962 [Puccinia graminis f. sp. tritici]|uniref:Uncharacterized protein n=1 Tax=Puccinia graminis f. sp. tritici TaxID=56615 RepID=A0A5B0M8V3_PUCGR|nr:hypothetical protein PGT21_018962 [Puccinia graminis f. sp. tritici]